MRISDWSSDVCSSDLGWTSRLAQPRPTPVRGRQRAPARRAARRFAGRSEEHTSELQSLMRISYAVFCLKKKKNKQQLLQHDIRIDIDITIQTAAVQIRLVTLQHIYIVPRQYNVVLIT